MRIVLAATLAISGLLLAGIAINDNVSAAWAALTKPPAPTAGQVSAGGSTAPIGQSIHDAATHATGG